MKVLIIGGGAGGASCAAKLRRLDETAEILVLEKTPENSVASSSCAHAFRQRDRQCVNTGALLKGIHGIPPLPVQSMRDRTGAVRRNTFLQLVRSVSRQPY